MNIDEINEYHDKIANAREMLGDIHTGDASRAQASLAAFSTYAARIDDDILKNSIDEYKVYDEPDSNHANVIMTAGGITVTSVSFLSIIRDIKNLKDRSAKNVWGVIKTHIPYITVGTFLIIAGVVLERSNHES